MMALCLQQDKSLRVIGLDIGDAILIVIKGVSSRAVYLDQNDALASEWRGD
ncbi:MAG: hypothetical protein ACE363_11720 [Alphaproteobacteria bacterium]